MSFESISRLYRDIALLHESKVKAEEQIELLNKMKIDEEELLKLLYQKLEEIPLLYDDEKKLMKRMEEFDLELENNRDYIPPSMAESLKDKIAHLARLRRRYGRDSEDVDVQNAKEEYQRALDEHRESEKRRLGKELYDENDKFFQILTFIHPVLNTTMNFNSVLELEQFLLNNISAVKQDIDNIILQISAHLEFISQYDSKIAKYEKVLEKFYGYTEDSGRKGR